MDAYFSYNASKPLMSERHHYNTYENSILIHMVNDPDWKYYYIDSNNEFVNKLLVALAFNYPKQTQIAKAGLCLNCYRHSPASLRTSVRDQIPPLLHSKPAILLSTHFYHLTELTFSLVSILLLQSITTAHKSLTI